MGTSSKGEISTLIQKMTPSRRLTQLLRALMLWRVQKRPKNYARKAKDSFMTSYLVNSVPQRANAIPPITLTLEDSIDVHYPHCVVLVVQTIVANNNFNRMPIDNRSSVNILFGTTYEKMQTDLELTPVTPF